jgi:RNA polymerase sigma factor (sigma-70 family)
VSDEEKSNSESVGDQQVGDFDVTLKAAIADAYPVLLQRIKIGNFGGWHRRLGREEDLANQATVNFMLHCRRHLRLPDNPLAYLVSIAKNLARKEYSKRLQDPVDAGEVLPIFLRQNAELAMEEEERPENTDRDTELVRSSIENLPRRQREAVELYLKNPDATYRELGQLMNIGPDGFEKNLERGFMKMREVLVNEGLARGIRVANLASSRKVSASVLL